MTLDVHHLEAKVAGLDCWRTKVSPCYLPGGLTNYNFIVEDSGQRFVVRVAEDLNVHGVWRRHEVAVSHAAYQAGVSPKICYCEPGVMVLEFIESKTLGEEDVKNARNIDRIIHLIKQAHNKIPQFLDLPTVLFWVFQVNRYYLRTIKSETCHLSKELTFFSSLNHQLEKDIQPSALVFGHNDLLAANFLDDGQRLWLIDWEYAGFNHPLFDLAGLSSNNQLSADDEQWLLEAYWGAKYSLEMLAQLKLMKCASLLRETLWSLVSDQHSKLGIDYVSYANENLSRLNHEYISLKEYGYE